MTTRPTRHDRFRWLSLFGLLALLAALACQPGPTQHEEGVGSEESRRFNFIRGKKQLLRIDTSSGEVWSVPESGDGGWVALGEAPEADEEPRVNGRYGLFSLVDRTNIAPPRLLRVDRSSGRAWIRIAEEGMAWRLVEAPPAEAGEDARVAPPEPTARSDSDTTPVQLPVVSREIIEASKGDESEKLAVVVQALQKEGLAVEIRVWAAKQLAVFEPELAIPPLLATLDDERPEVIVAAIGSLQKLGDPTTIPKVLALESHPDPKVRDAAREAVAGLH